MDSLLQPVKCKCGKTVGEVIPPAVGRYWCSKCKKYVIIKTAKP